MIKWKRIKKGEYESDDGRFRIVKMHDDIQGRYWLLCDYLAKQEWKRYFQTRLFTDCKLKAKLILEDERKEKASL